jgi:hypothetical protein
MTRLATLASGVMLCTLAVSACGSSGSSSSSRSPAQVLADAAGPVSSMSVRFDGSAAVTVDASKVTGVSPGILGQISAFAQGGSVTATGEQEKAGRDRLTLSFDAGGQKQSITLVVYDGQLFYSTDGKTFGSGGSLKDYTGGVGIAPADIGGYIKSFPGFQDKGSTQQDGVTVEHYQAALDKSALGTLLPPGQGSGSSSTGGGTSTSSSTSTSALSGALGFLEQLIDVKSGTADAYVTPDGHLERFALQLSLGLDFTKLGPLLNGLAALGGSGSSSTATSAPAGALTVDVTLGAHFTDYGSAITVTKPTVDPNAPPPPSFPGGLGG